MRTNLTNSKKYFLKKVKKTNYCWFWFGRKTNTGYGSIRFTNKKKTGPKSTQAHRISWIFFRGPIPANMFVLHKCDIRNCVNPEHLFLGTHTDNMRDKWDKGRGFHPNKKGTHNFYCAKFTKEEAIQIRELRTNKNMKITDIMKQFPASESTIGAIIRKESYRFD